MSIKTCLYALCTAAIATSSFHFFSGLSGYVILLADVFLDLRPSFDCWCIVKESYERRKVSFVVYFACPGSTWVVVFVVLQRTIFTSLSEVSSTLLGVSIGL